MKVAVIGGTGFVGVYLVERLLAEGHRPRLLVRYGSGSKVERADDCEIVLGDVEQPDAMDRCLEGTDAVIYLIGLLRELPTQGITFVAMHRAGVECTIAAARGQGVERFLLMSANGVRPDGTAYQRTKYQADEALKASGLRWTIFRPSVIFGDPRGRMEFCSQLKRDLIDSPLPAPLFFPGWLPTHAGDFELAPVAVEDVAAAFTLALSDPSTESQTYSLCGPDRLSWKIILQTIASASGRTKWMLPAPALAVGVVAGLLDRFPWFPITRDQLRMLIEGNVCYENDGFARLGLTPTHFGPDALSYLRG
jgi:NADH dehydrogenase